MGKAILIVDDSASVRQVVSIAFNLDSSVTLPHSRRQTRRRRQVKWQRNSQSGRENFVDNVTHEHGPAIRFRQLRRVCHNMVEALADIGNHRLDLITMPHGIE